MVVEAIISLRTCYNLDRMVQFGAQNPSAAWLKATRYIVEHGERVGELSREVLYLLVEIEHPLEVEEKTDREFRRFVGDKWVDKIAEEFPHIPKRGHYSYWERLINYDGINQVDYIIKRLKKAPRSKQAFCVTFDPHLDIKPMLLNPRQPYLLMPCLTSLDFKCREGRLNLFAVFRSHDFGRKAYGNYIGLGRLLSFVAQKAGHTLGKVVCASCSAHIRAKEFGTLKKLVSKLEARKWK